MSATVLIISTCLISEPTNCRDVELIYEEMNPMQCMWGAQPEIAKWMEAHPKWTLKKWKCKTKDQSASLDKDI